MQKEQIKNILVVQACRNRLQSTKWRTKVKNKKVIKINKRSDHTTKKASLKQPLQAPNLKDVKNK